MPALRNAGPPRTQHAVDPVTQPQPQGASSSPTPQAAPSAFPSKRADSRLLSEPVPTLLVATGPPVPSSLNLSSLVNKFDPYHKAPSSRDCETAAPPGSSSQGGTSVSSYLFRQDHWRGLRRKRPNQVAPILEPRRESPAPESSASSNWSGWRDWSEWEKCNAKSFLSPFVCFCCPRVLHPYARGGPKWPCGRTE